jgi:hypothetical protein
LRAELEAKTTGEKEEEIKMVEAEILQLKADIYNLKVGAPSVDLLYVMSGACCIMRIVSYFFKYCSVISTIGEQNMCELLNSTLNSIKVVRSHEKNASTTQCSYFFK